MELRQLRGCDWSVGAGSVGGADVGALGLSVQAGQAGRQEMARQGPGL